MNREQRRKLIKIQPKKDRKTLKTVMDRTLIKDGIFSDGDKVFVKVDEIVSRNPESLTQKYLEFIEDCRGKKFTVEIDKTYKNGTMISLKEDKNEPKYLFWQGDLELVK
ncbi:MAG: hypothetical protein WCO84_01130 [bacterium]